MTIVEFHVTIVVSYVTIVVFYVAIVKFLLSMLKTLPLSHKILQLPHKTFRFFSDNPCLLLSNIFKGAYHQQQKILQSLHKILENL